MSRTENSKLKPGDPRPKQIVSALLAWFSRHARDLPWRRTRDPYAIWLSEIMLQQTQVKTVVPYWKRWMRELPTLETLAAASSDKVHKLWEGLGYYTRVRNLQKAARQIVAQQGTILESRRRRGDEAQIGGKLEAPPAFVRLRRGKHVVTCKFPEKFDDVLALPGIGRYTAGAICSIAFNQPTPILDGNVIRVLTRVFGIGSDPREKKTNAELWKIAEELVVHASRSVSHASPCSHFNQSLMELGALICTPRSPQCPACPLKTLCVAFNQDRIQQLPNLARRGKPTARRFAAFVIERHGKFLARQRPAGGVNAQLWEFPNVEIGAQPGQPRSAAEAARTFGLELQNLNPFRTIKHSITRYRITLEAYRAGTPVSDPAQSGNSVMKAPGRKPALRSRWLTLSKLNELSFPSAHKKILAVLAEARS